MHYDNLHEISNKYNIPIYLIEFSINFAEKNKIMIKNSKQIEGYIQTLQLEKRKVYLFNPKWNDKSTLDLYLPIIFRQYGPLYKKKDINIPQIKSNSIKSNISDEISHIFEKINSYKKNNNTVINIVNTRGWDLYNFIFIQEKYKGSLDNIAYDNFFELIKYSKINHLLPNDIKTIILKDKYAKYMKHFEIEKNFMLIPKNEKQNDIYKVNHASEKIEKVTSIKQKEQIYKQYNFKINTQLKYLGFYELNSNIISFKIIKKVDKFFSKTKDNRTRPTGVALKSFSVNELKEIIQFLTQEIFPPPIYLPTEKDLDRAYTKDFLCAEIELLFLYNYYYHKSDLILLFHINEYIIVKNKLKNNKKMI